MKLLKIILTVFLGIWLFLASTSSAQAQSEFSVDATVTYDVQDSGKTVVIHSLILENNFSTLYATNYSLGLENITAQNIKITDANGAPIPFDVQKDGTSIKIKVNFPDAVVGKGNQRRFSISYENGSFAVRTGEIWEVSIPRLGEETSFRSYRILLKIPSSFGFEAYISPKPANSQTTEKGYVYEFNRNDIAQTGISAGFGQFQIFTYSLAYHLENPLGKSAKVQIAIPPDTAFQKVYIQKLDPKPADVTVDANGNWLAEYVLTPRQRVDVTVSGSVQIFASFRTFPKPTDQALTDNLRETEFWQVNDPQIKALAAELKTPKAIYEYVASTLKYDIERVKPNVQRMGASAALKNTSQAICMEFTDLFVAIARAAGIPAREINGYAYTENPELQPLGLVADVLHAWPEYYDKDKGVWIPIDPTWASTSGGINYFDKLDLRHFAFVIHGDSAVTPYPPGSYKLGSNPQKDVYVSFGKLPEERAGNLNISFVPVRILPFLNSIYSVKIGNPGPQAMYNLYTTTYFDGKEVDRTYVEVIPPYSNYKMNITVPFSLLGKGSPNIVEVKAAGSTVSIATNKTQVITYSLLAISGLFIIIMTALLIKFRKITFGRLFATIASVKQKIHGRFIKRPPENKNNP